MPRIVKVNSGQNQASLGRRLVQANGSAVISDREYDKLSSTAFNTNLTDLGPGVVILGSVTLSTITTNAQVVATVTPGYLGRVKSVFAIVTTVASTAGKTVALAPYIDGVRCIGGDLTLTTAKVTPGNAVLGSSIVKAKGDFGPTGVVTIRTTALPTAFAEGVVLLGIQVAPQYKDGPALL